MLDFIVDFFVELFFEIFLETTVGIPLKKFIEFISNKVKSKPLRIIIYISSLLACIGIIIALIAGIIFGTQMLITAISK